MAVCAIEPTLVVAAAHRTLSSMLLLKFGATG
jgi:hypothetical protein